MSSSSSQGKGKSAPVSGNTDREDDNREQHGQDGGVALRGGQGPDVLIGTNGADSIKGAAGGDTIYGLGGNDDLKGNTGDDTIYGGAGNDEIKGDTGNDLLDGGSGSDHVDAGSGNDVAIYVMSENTGAKDEYDGGSGVDTLRLVFTRDEWMRADVQADVARYLAFLAANTNPSGQANGHEFEFKAFNLEVEKFEKLEVMVDGQMLDPRDQLADAINDAAQADEDGAVGGNVLANDNVPDLVRSVELVTGPAHGQLTFNADGSYLYVPGSYFNALAQGETATETFVYKVTDADGDTDTATVTITITGSNDGPVATADTAGGEENQALVINVLANDTDVDHGAVLHVVSAAVAVGQGAVSVNADNTLAFAPGTDFDHLAAGTSTLVAITYTVADEHGAQDTKTVTVTVTGTNDAPVVTSGVQAGVATEDTVLSVTGQVTSADVDDGATATYTGNANGAYGSFVVDAASGAWTYTLANGAPATQALAAGESRQEVFAVTVTDDQGATATQNVIVTVTGTNDAPVITAGETTGAVTEDGASTATGHLVVLDPDHNATQTWTVMGGTSSANADYQFRADSFTVIRNGTTLFQDNFSDGVAPPSAPASPGTNGYTGIGVNAGALTESGGKLVFDSSLAIPFEGVGTPDPIVGQNAILRTNIDPASASGLKSTADFSIQAVFDLALPDSPREAYGIRATDRLVGGPGNPPDQLGDDVIELMVLESRGGELRVALREVDFVADQTTLIEAMALNAPAGADQIRLKLDHAASDVGALHASFEFLSGGVVIGSQAFSQVGRIFGTETPGDTSDDENWTRAEILARAPLHSDSVLSGDYGTLYLTQSGEWTYSLDNTRATTQSLAAGETVTDVFTVTVADEHGATDSQTVTVTVTGTNDGPVVLTQNTARALAEDSPTHALTATGLVQFDDVDLADTHTVGAALQSATVAGGSLPAGAAAALATAMSATLVDASTGEGHGDFRWDFALDDAATQFLAAGQTLTATYQVSVSDSMASAAQTVTITITGSNDGPVVAVADVTGAATEALAPAGNLTDSGTLAFADVDLADVHSVGAVTPSAGALGTLTASVTADTTGSGSGGEVTWNYSVDAAAVEYLAAGQTKVENFSFDVLDGQGGSMTRTVSVTLTGTNDAPVITGGDASGAVTAVALAPEAPPQPLTFTVQQYLGFQSNDLSTLRNYATTHDASYTVQTNVIDYTDDPAGFAGELPGSNRWPAAEAQNVTGTGGINNTFFARITADFSVSTADTYTFRTYNDDGVFLLVDNNLIISDAGYHPEAPFQGSIALAPGNHTIELFFYENGGEASLEFSARNSTGSFGLVGANGGGFGGAISQVTDSGVIAFADVDLSDAHAVSVAPVGSTLGTLTAVKNADTTGTGTGGEVTWSYNVSNAAIAYLDEGETRVESFTVTVNDQHGGVTTQQVDVTITGTNDTPAITGGVSTGAVVEDGASSATGQLIVLDADHNATQTWTVVGGTSSGDANYQFRADSFTVIRNGSTLFQDNFSDGIAPPSAPAFPGTNGYTGIGANSGAFSESGGKLVFDSSEAVLFEGTGTTDPIVGQNAVLRTNIDPANLASGLKSNANFSIQGVFDLVLPDSPREAYGIRATDRLVGGPGTPPDQLGDDTIELMVRESLNGNLQVVLREVDNVADVTNNLQSIALNAPAGADQIRLRLDHSTTDVGALHASFDYLSNGVVVGTQAFTAVGRIFGTETPGDTSDDENWTRAEILARAPLHDDSVLTGQYGNLNVNQSGEWTYTLDNSRAATQALAAGQTATDTFMVKVADEHGATDMQAVTVTVTGTNDAPVIFTGPVSRTMGEDGAGHQLAATGQMQFEDVDLTDTHTVSAALQSASINGGGAVPAGLQSALSGAISTVLLNSAQDGHGDLQWNFSLNDAATQFLNAGQTLTAVYNVTVSDGTASAVQSVTVNITGANDNPVAVNDTGALTVTSLASQVHTNVVNWVDWTSASAGKVSGTIDLGNGQTIGVTYTGEYAFAQTNSGTNYYTGPAGTYTSAAVANGPTGWDIIALSQATQKTLTFSQPVDNLFFAIVSLNGNGYLFDQDFQIASYGPGFFGSTSSVSKVALPDGRYEVVTPSSSPNELHGVLQIQGTVQSLTWTSLTPEYWNGFTVGTYGKAQTATATGNLLANDTPGNAGDTLTVTAVNGQAIPGNYVTLELASGARLTVNKDGTYLYDEDGAFGALGQGQTAQDTFTYTLTDNHGVSSTATATITVTGINDGPTAAADAVATNEDTPLTLTAAALLANDTDPDAGDALSLVSVQGATHGTVSLTGGNVTFTPDANYNGAANFTYTMKDAAGATSTATVSVTVNPVNDAPFATNDGATTAEDTPVTINVLANDTDADGDALTVTGVSGLSHGTAQIVGNKIVFTPNANFSGTELLSYTVSDGHGGSDTAGVVVNVTPVNDAPTLVVPASAGGAWTIGNEFRANTTTASDQYLPDVTVLKDGSYVIAWSSYNQDGSGYGTYAKHYAADGSLMRDEFLLNQTTVNNQMYVKLAALDSGGFAATWSGQGVGGQPDDVMVRTFDAAGNATGGEVMANQYVASTQYLPSITAVKDGGFVVVWNSNGQDGSDYGVFGRKFDATGTAQGNEFQINTYGTNQQFADSNLNYAVSGLGDGGFVAVWRSYLQDGSGWGVYGQRYDGSGAKVGGEFQVNAVSTGDQLLPSVAGLADGGFLVTWMASTPSDGSGNGVFAQRYDAAGNTTGGQFQVNTYTASDQGYPRAVSLADGGFAIEWISYGQDGNGWGTYLQRYDQAGAKVGGEIQLNQYTSSDQLFTGLDGTANGGLVAAWSSYNQDGSGYGVYARAIQGSGLSVNEDTPVAVSGISVADVDAGAAGLQLTLSAGHGALHVLANVAGGLDASGISGNDSGSVVLTGTAAQINATLAASGGLTYQGAANYHGADTLNATVSDLGHTGAGGALTSTGAINITVNQVSDTFVLSNLVVNGSFEQSSGGGTSNGSTAITGWTVTGSDVDRVASSGWQSGDGSYSLDLNGFHPGGVQQVLATTPGVQYTVGFDLSKNPGNTDHATVLVSVDNASGTSQSYTFNAANSSTSMQWSQQTFTFVATGTSTTLSFGSTYPTDATGGFPVNAQGPALDEVVVVANKTIDNFTQGAGGDVLQLHDVLTSVNAPHDSTAFSGGFVRFLQSGGDTLVQLDADGGGNAYLTLATLHNTLLTQADTANYTL